jgi:hypothetical protein
VIWNTECISSLLHYVSRPQLARNLGQSVLDSAIRVECELEDTSAKPYYR